jgi:hypothetical protein
LTTSGNGERTLIVDDLFCEIVWRDAWRRRSRRTLQTDTKMSFLLFILLLSIVIDCTSGLYQFHSDNPFRGKLLGCKDLKDVKVGAPFAKGQKKQVLR